ncbi:phage integrase family protein [Mariniflexile fucanivorans]|uniref:Phage integrase family protein n=1 Tax=Mariniflexile fucanivorans TaxID=264023 RepID=A0A4R1RKS7_9FLAO|nr:site-specific integrase [Mariniflexile fucanivorans]TCL66676.1 phage integrase family protein [Mariniflexile fucanivorans]
MKTDFSIHFHLINSKINNKGLAPIYLRLTVNNKRVEYSISRRLEPKFWNSKTQRVMGTNRDSVEINNHIDNLKHKLNKIHQRLMDEDARISATSMINLLKGGGKKVRFILEIFKEHNERTDLLAGKDISVSTAKRYWTCYDHVKQFIEEEYRLEDYKLRDIDYRFVTKFEFFLKTVRICNHNSALKYINNFKKIIRIALANQWMDKDPFYNFKVKFEAVERDFLTAGEVETLYTKELHFDRLKVVRDMFVFSCYTGLAYSDVEKLTKADITIGIDGDKWISIKRTKTNTRSSIPLLPIAEEILNRYAYHPEVIRSEKLIPVFSNQKSNAFLKEIAIMCGITKPLTTHLARHTFATTITLTNGVPIESVSKMLGHKSLRTTQHYAKIVDRKVSDDMKVLKEKLDLQTKTNKTDSNNS